MAVGQAFSGGDLPEHAIAEHPTVHQQARTSCQWLAERPNSKSHCPPTSQEELPMASCVAQQQSKHYTQRPPSITTVMLRSSPCLLAGTGYTLSFSADPSAGGHERGRLFLPQHARNMPPLFIPGLLLVTANSDGKRLREHDEHLRLSRLITCFCLMSASAKKIR